MSSTELAIDDALTGKVVPSLDDLVNRWEQADRTAENATWAKADVALETEVYGKGDIQEFAERVGIPVKTIYTYRSVAKAWPILTRGKTSMKVARAFMAQPDRYELVQSRDWTASEARELVRSRRELPGGEGAALPKPKREPFLTAVSQIFYSAEYLSEKTAGRPDGLTDNEWKESVKQLKAARTMISRCLSREDES